MNYSDRAFGYWVQLALIVGMCGCKSTAPAPEVTASSHTFGQLSAKRDLEKKLKSWEVAYGTYEDKSLWISHGDFHDKTLIAKNADSPAWSRDGQLLAYRHGTDIVVKDFKSGKVHNVAKVTRESDEFDYPKFVMSFDSTRRFLNIPIKGKLITVDLDHPGKTLPSVPHGDSWIEGAPALSPSGNLLAFTREGDVWLAKRHEDDRGDGQSGAVFENMRYYFTDAERVAATARWHDSEGGSASTPYWADKLIWLDEKTLMFHFQRQGGSGISSFGFISLDAITSKLNRADLRASVKWLGQESLMFDQALCPDGKTITAVRRAKEGEDLSFYVIDKDANPILKLYPDFTEDATWRPVSNQAKN